jgi:ribosomal protein S27E
MFFLEKQSKSKVWCSTDAAKRWESVGSMYRTGHRRAEKPQFLQVLCKVVVKRHRGAVFPSSLSGGANSNSVSLRTSAMIVLSVASPTRKFNMIPCPECGRQTAAEAAACTNCGHALANGTQAKSPAEKPPPPPEVSGWVIHKTPPAMIEEMRRTFNEKEYLAELREAEGTGGVKFEDFIGEIEEMVKRRD